MQGDVEVLIDQCKKPFRVYNLANKRKHITFRKTDGSPTLYSGTTLTTLLNNTACLNIGVSIIESGAETPDEIIHAAELAGYIVTLEACEIFEDVQFLKHSPVLNTQGYWRPVLNLGVFLRSTGRCRRDLPGRTADPLHERTKAHEAALIQGMYPRTHFPFIEYRRAQVTTPNQRIYRQAVKLLEPDLQYKVSDTTHENFNSRDIYRRYRLTSQEQTIMDHYIGKGDYRRYYACNSLNTILKRDYRLGCPTL
jgi:hypothetical protein